MGNYSVPVAMTAIAHPESEGFISSTLFEQGWSVDYRALDADALLNAVQAFSGKELSLFISTDIDGLDPEKIEVLKTLSQKLFLFQSALGDNGYRGALPLPENSLELATLIRSMQRAPLIQTVQKSQPNSARIIAIASAGHAYGTTTLALNLSHELSLQGKKTLLVDADSECPSIAISLDQRQLRESKGWRAYSEQLSLMEISQQNIAENIAALDEAAVTFDYIIIDLAKITRFSEALNGRRWSAEAAIWASKFADELWITAQKNIKGIEALKMLNRELQSNEIRPKLRMVIMAQGAGRRAEAELDAMTGLISNSTFLTSISIPHDPRAAHEAAERQSTLADTNMRGVLRKSLTQLAEKLTA